jgi:hypothetical protein
MALSASSVIGKTRVNIHFNQVVRSSGMLRSMYLYKV